MKPNLEKAANAIIEIYETHGKYWAKLRNRAPLPELKYLIKLGGLIANNSRILDLGCGDGVVAEYFSNKGHFVLGIDSSNSLLEAFKLRLPKCETKKEDIRDFEVPNGFDLILIWHSLFHLRPKEQETLIQKIGKACKSGAILAFTSGDKADESLGEFASNSLYHASLSPEQYNNVLHAAGFEVIHNALNDQDCGNISVWIAAKT